MRDQAGMKSLPSSPAPKPVPVMKKSLRLNTSNHA